MVQKQVVVITGGAQGIGFATALRLARDGVAIAIWDADQAAIDDASKKLGDIEHYSVKVDITDAQNVSAATKATENALGPITILVNSAGITGPNTTVEDYDLDQWRRVIDVNLTGTFITNQAVVKRMKTNGYGRILNIASVAGKEGNPNASAYSASKAGVIGLTKSLGKELADQNISVNCLTPAAAKTRIFDQMTEEHINYMLSKIPRGRFLEVDEAANMIAWLVSEENSFTTGGVFDLSGGRATY
ncbi:SDR family NAD(P)-dependent oxidoreductase [Lentilitoribacter sp. Alg239-R112]|uniref:SDR family NAD(P)-dependent oxidoreductase n=1 Tax=Lentilitoribacter sp. Alg239-R112 TaxID=2305987 RepID=UPI0013A6A44C|nr:SDR family NAD(P)-dependent oxidoreductase [Lentilitoribacter sp. Alg239-R112]